MSIYIVDYSERAIAVFGETKSFKNKLTEIGGKYNASLTHNNEKKAGWIFPKGKKNMIENLIQEIQSGSILPETSNSQKSFRESNDDIKENNNTKTTSSLKVDSNLDEILKNYVSKKDYMNLVSIVERLEQEVAILKGSNKSDFSSKGLDPSNSSNKNKSKILGMISLPSKETNLIKSKSWADEEDDEEEEQEIEEPIKGPSLLRGKK